MVSTLAVDTTTTPSFSSCRRLLSCHRSTLVSIWLCHYRRDSFFVAVFKTKGLERSPPRSVVGRSCCSCHSLHVDLLLPTSCSRSSFRPHSVVPLLRVAALVDQSGSCMDPGTFTWSPTCCRGGPIDLALSIDFHLIALIFRTVADP